MREVVNRVPYYDLSRSSDGSPIAVNRGYVLLVREDGVDKIIFESMETSMRLKLERDGIVYHGLWAKRIYPTNLSRFVSALENRNALIDAIVGLPRDKRETPVQNFGAGRAASFFIMIFVVIALVSWLVFAKTQ